MIYLVYGGSGSGKSSFAEKLLAGFTSNKKYYIATMKAQKNDEDAQKKIARHKKMRSGKGFKTIEQPKDLEKINVEDGASALLECMSNLCANEMFDAASGTQKSEDEVCKKIITGIKGLSSVLENLVIVTNNVFEDGVQYDESTKIYIRVLAKINCELAKISDKVYEVVVGISMELK